MRRAVFDPSLWPGCAIADCPHKACLPSDLCYAHAHRLPLNAEDPRVAGYFGPVEIEIDAK